MSGQQLSMAQDLGNRLLLVPDLILDPFRQDRAKESQSIGALGKVKWRNAFQDRWVMQCQVEHQTLGAE